MSYEIDPEDGQEHRVAVRAAARAAFDFANESDEYSDRFELWWATYSQEDPSLAARENTERSEHERNLDPVLVEKVALVIEHRTDGCWGIDELAEVVTRVVFDELGLKEERMDRVGGPPEQPWIPERRFVSDWRLVEQGDAE
jgi:hypothetical protein